MKAKRPLRPTRIKTPKPEAAPKVDKAKEAAKAEAAKAAKAKADAKEAEKAKRDQEKAAKLTKVEAKLEPIAKEILYKLESAEKMDSKADDHRLSAAIQFDKAKKMCDDAGINFKDWSAKHVPNQSYETIRQLVRVGASDNPALALADLRKGNAERNKTHRANKKRVTSTPEAAPKSGSKSPSTAFQRAEAVMSEMPEDTVRSFVSSQASQLGLQVLTDAEVKQLKAATPAPTGGKKGDPAWLAVINAYKALSKDDRVDFQFELSELTGYKLIPAEQYKQITALPAYQEMMDKLMPKKGKKAAE